MIKLRPATDDERNGLVRTQWLHRVMPDQAALVGNYRAPRRGHELELGLARRMLEQLVLGLLDRCVVLVAEFDDKPGELLGWVASDAQNVHFVLVIGGYGRRGLGSALLLRAGWPAKAPSYWTPDGKALINALAARKVQHAS
jgi:hypothetical protein